MEYAVKLTNGIIAIDENVLIYLKNEMNATETRVP